ncbi:hypothetical protein [Rhodobacter capsulatus]|uniref:hypothetical protein n=1 Tax=Rhodobacter capsulatus TaxID=1061 RepID=UPI004028B7C6
MAYHGRHISIEDAVSILENAIEIVLDLKGHLGIDPEDRCLVAHEVLAAAQFTLDQHMSEMSRK